MLLLARSNPKTRAYADDPDFVAKVKAAGASPEAMNSAMQDPRISELLTMAIMAASGQDPSQMFQEEPEEEVQPTPKPKAKEPEPEPEPEPQPENVQEANKLKEQGNAEYKKKYGSQLTTEILKQHSSCMRRGKS